MRLNDIELIVRVKGRPITEYPHQDQMFVEGRAGSEYELEVRNDTYQRVEAVLSVDGLSVIDGTLAGAQSRGYLIPARDSIRIPGWTLNSAQVAKFAFAGKQDSYATQMTGDARNNGVIGVMVYREKINFVPNIFCSAQWAPHTPVGGSSICTSNPVLRGIPISSSGWTDPGAQPSRGNSMSSKMSSNATASPSYSSTSVQQDIAQQSLGTGFGESATFATRSVSFQRGGVICTMVIGYDEKRGLKARGVVMPAKRTVRHEPQAFPAMACRPPPGWSG